jgi:glycogen operon protein
MASPLKVLPGKSFPLGATVYPHGVNFCLFSNNATRVELLLFDSQDHASPTHVIELDRNKNRTHYYWHALVPGLKQGQLYAYRVHGPFEPRLGHRFDGEKVLVDPYARAVVTNTYDRQAAIDPGDNCAKAIKSVVIDPKDYDWEGDVPLNKPFEKSIIYELHVGGFTRHHNSGLPERLRGSYAGLIEKIPYLQELGITTVELMPIQQFDPFDIPHPELTNYWGYSPIAFFAPHNGYGSTEDPVGVVNEFRDMVKALHKANIGVILDVVFNHTAEGDHQGPTLSFKGLENRSYYLLEENRTYYKNYSGTGNTMSANHSIVRRMIMQCLKHWVSEMHVDGFRFDLAAVLARDEHGNTIENPPILWSIESDPVLAPTKIIAEAWDIDTYLLGTFQGNKWAEWNGRFRDDVRRFMKSDDGMLYDFSRRLMASVDLFGDVIRNPNRSVNFITCHDGFTLNDLVSYNDKHNWSNGEDNRDGTDFNYSWNCGEEGPSINPEVEALRRRQIKNFLTVLMVSQGTPMLLMGDEVRRTQKGNNNAYCQDNDTSWFNWDLLKEEEELFSFVKKLIKFNLSTPYFQESHFWIANSELNPTNFALHGTLVGHVDWGEKSHAIAFSLDNPAYDHQLHVMINAYWEPLTFELPREGVKQWRCLINTAAEPPHDFCGHERGLVIENFAYEVAGRSVVVARTERKAQKAKKGGKKK